MFLYTDSKELMYQQVLRRFAHFNAIQLSDPAPLSELIMLALKEEDLDPECNENDDLIEKITEVICTLFRSTMFYAHYLPPSLSLCLFASINLPPNSLKHLIPYQLSVTKGLT